MTITELPAGHAALQRLQLIDSVRITGKTIEEPILQSSNTAELRGSIIPDAMNFGRMGHSNREGRMVLPGEPEYASLFEMTGPESIRALVDGKHPRSTRLNGAMIHQRQLVIGRGYRSVASSSWFHRHITTGLSLLLNLLSETAERPARQITISLERISLVTVLATMANDGIIGALFDNQERQRAMEGSALGLRLLIEALSVQNLNGAGSELLRGLPFKDLAELEQILTEERLHLCGPASIREWQHRDIERAIQGKSWVRHGHTTITSYPHGNMLVIMEEEHTRSSKKAPRFSIYSVNQIRQNSADYHAHCWRENKLLPNQQRDFNDRTRRRRQWLSHVLGPDPIALLGSETISRMGISEVTEVTA